MKENQLVEWKESWRDEYLKWICGFANAQGGTLVIGKNDSGKVVGLANVKTLLEEIPNKIKDILGVVADVDLRTADGIDYIEIHVEPYPYPVSYKGQYHYRSGSTKQELTGNALNAFLLKKYGLHWDAVPLPLLLPDDLDPEAFRLFSQKAVQSKRLGDEILKESPTAMLKKLHSSGNPVQISVYDNKIIFWNAGKLPDQLTIDMLQTKHPSIPYNPLIASAFFRAGYIETWGRGIEKINNECSMADVPLPEFNYQYAGLMITFFAGSISNRMEAPEETQEESIEKTREKTKKTREKTRETVEKTVEKTREKTREKIIIAIKENPEIRITELAKQLNLTKKGIEWQMNKLKELGIINRIGSKKDGIWEIIEK